MNYLVNPVLLSSLPVGGSESLRSYWKMYLPKVLLLVYVVDSADHARLPMAKQLLHQLIQNNSTLPVVVLANKQVRVPCCWHSFGNSNKAFQKRLHAFKECIWLGVFLHRDSPHLLTTKQNNLRYFWICKMQVLCLVKMQSELWVETLYSCKVWELRGRLQLDVKLGFCSEYLPRSTTSPS